MSGIRIVDASLTQMRVPTVHTVAKMCRGLLNAALLRLAQKIARDTVQALERLGGAGHELNRQATPGAGCDRLGGSTAPPGKTAKRNKPAPPSIQYTISAGAIRAPVESISPSPRDKTSRENREKRARH
jgi:hypothetical protein